MQQTFNETMTHKTIHIMILIRLFVEMINIIIQLAANKTESNLYDSAKKEWFYSFQAESTNTTFHLQ